MSKLTIVNLTKRPAPSGPFDKLKEKILGLKYDLSLVFYDSALAKKLNKEKRGEDKVANILSFPLTKNSGEIFIKLPVVNFSVASLFIHGLLHLKGFRHGSKMETEENRINGQSAHHRWAGRGNRVGTARRLRT